MEILTVHYNTPELMDAMIRSVRKFTDCTIHVFDNSDIAPFRNTYENVDVIDNTQGQIIDFDRWLEQYPERRPRLSNYGSPKHCKTVNTCFDLFPNGFILMDSDVLVKKDITGLWDERYAWVGEPFLDTPKGVPVMRLLPFLCYINVPMCKEKGIKYFNWQWMWHLTATSPNKWYDTGAWFYRDCVLLPPDKAETGVFGRFCGKPLDEIVSPKGAGVKYSFKTSKGSEYVLTSDRMSQRVKKAGFPTTDFINGWIGRCS